MTAIWEQILKVQPIGIHDPFFELGGTSLRAVELMAEIKRRLGQSLPLTAVVEAPTVAALTKLVSGGQVHDSLVLIRPGDNRPPLFLVHDGDGETLLYRNLAQELAPGQAVYGLQPYSLPKVPMAHLCIEDMARHHAERIRSIQPHGPYLLGGMCAGGVIAYEIARILRNQGEAVALVALLDSADPAARLRPLRETRQRLKSFATLLDDQDHPPLRRWAGVAIQAARKAKNLAVYLALERWRRLRDEIRLRALRSWVDRRRIPPRWLQHIPVRTVYLFAERHYHPHEPLDQPLLLVRASCGVGNDEPYQLRYQDPLLGWGPRTQEEVQVIDVPGGHSSMLQPPHVRVLAQHLQTAIEQGLANAQAGNRDDRLASLQFPESYDASLEAVGESTGA